MTSASVPTEAGARLSEFVGALGDDERLDRFSGPVGDAVRRALDRQPLKDLLSGTWLGHPLHPLLTDLPIGFWTSAFTLDLLGGRHSRRAATRLVAWGVLSALPTAASGAADWGDTTGPDRRIGLVHAAANTTALACYAASWSGAPTRTPRPGCRARARGCDRGHRRRVPRWAPVADPRRRRRPCRVPGATRRVDTGCGAAGEITQQPRRFLAGEAPVIVFRRGDALVALDVRCPHRGAPMEQASEHDGCLVCPWHGSRFRADDGSLVQGPSTVALPAYECRIVGSDVEVRSG